MKKKMGVMAGLTNEFNISSRRRLQDTVCLKFNPSSQKWGKCHKVEAWIKNDPVALYKFVHSGGCALNRDVHRKLRDAVFKIFPDLILETNRRKHEILTTRGKGRLLD